MTPQLRDDQRRPPEVVMQDRPSSSLRRRLLWLLLSTSVGASLLSFLYPVLRFVLPPAAAGMEVDSIVAAKTNELTPNSGKIFRSFKNRPGLLIRLSDGNYRGFTAVCTHLQCTVQFRPTKEDIWCACHNGIYDLHGRNVSGPPPRPLEHYDVHFRGEDVVVTRRSTT